MHDVCTGELFFGVPRGVSRTVTIIVFHFVPHFPRQITWGIKRYDHHAIQATVVVYESFLFLL